jgi:hypothetical protein
MVDEVNTVIHIHVSQDVGNFLTSSETTRFSRVTQPHEMSHLNYCHAVFLDQIMVYGVSCTVFTQTELYTGRMAVTVYCTVHEPDLEASSICTTLLVV